MADYISREVLLDLIAEKLRNTCSGSMPYLEIKRMVEIIPAARLMGYEVVEEEEKESDMKCYREGGCGPYEMQSCSECPASKPEFVEKKEVYMGKQSTTSQENQPEAVNYGSSKPLRDWTLGEVKEYCKSRVATWDEETEGKGCCIACLLRGFCRADGEYWKLAETPCFTQDELTMLRLLHKSGVDKIQRGETGMLYWVHSDGPGALLPDGLLPSLGKRQEIVLKEVLEDAE